jgi:UDP-N-acetylmuramate--alanine ligase
MNTLSTLIENSHKLYFIGIGGVGMSALAHIMHARGFSVSGSDLSQSRYTDLLQSHGCIIEIGHSVKNIDADIVIISSAISETNPLRKLATERQIPIIHRSQLLGYIMNTSTSYGVTGTHGKTTTSSLLSYCMNSLGMTPTCIIGGTMHNFGSNALFGKGDYVVAEVDESDKSLLNIHPTIGIITNIDNDHLDVYKDIHEIISTMKLFVDNIKPEGSLIYNADDCALRDIVQSSKIRSLSYALDMPADLRGVNISFGKDSTSFDLIVDGAMFRRVCIPLYGRHNVYNVLAVLAAFCASGIPLERLMDILPAFKGVKRRIDIHFHDEYYRVLDDYAHHPTEIKATIAVLNQMKKSDESLWVIFQPHRYSRTAHLMDELTHAFVGVDQLIITDIYAASEEPIAGVSVNHLIEKIKTKYFFPVEHVSIQSLSTNILARVPARGIIAFLGAGDINEVAHEFSVALQNNCIRK